MSSSDPQITQIAQMTEKTKSVSGEQVPMSKFAYVGDPEDLETWKLPIHDAAHVRNALARFGQTDLPADKKEAVYGKIVEAAKKFGIEVSEKSSDIRPVLVLLSGPLREITIAVAGNWESRNLSITREDLAAMVRNFEKRKDHRIVIDYEHASEMPEVARGGPIPAAGWIHGLHANGQLIAEVEWTPQAEEMIRTGQYRGFSPAINMDARDKETGEAQGATLTSGALTNHPFLEELPPIVLTDVSPQITQMTQKESAESVKSADKGGKSMKFTLMKKVAGRRALMDEDGKMVHEFALDDLDMDDAELDVLMAKRQPGAMKMRETAERAALYSECVCDGRIDLDKAAGLADDGKIGIRDYRQVQKAQELVEKAIQEGKFAPADREYISRVALADVARFEEWAKKKPRAVPVGAPVGVAARDGGAPGTPDSELAMRLATLMSEKSLDRKAALDQLAKDDPELVRRYRAGPGRIQ